MIIIGVGREIFGGLPHVTCMSTPGPWPVGHHQDGLLTFAAIYVLGARVRQRRVLAHRNRGGVQRGERAPGPPEGRNAKQLLVIPGQHRLLFLIAGISWLAHVTHAVPYT